MYSPPVSNRNDETQFAKFRFDDSKATTDKTVTGINSPLSMNSMENRNIKKNPLNADDPLNSSKRNSNNQYIDDEFSITSTVSHSSNDDGNNPENHNSLIFERLVQDPLTDSQPIPNSLPRHITTESFIPASLDTANHLLLNDSLNSTSTELDNAEPPTNFGFQSRRSSLANLEAALGSRRGSTSQLSRTNTNSSFSNLTQQFQNASRKRIPQNNNLPQLTTTLSTSSTSSFSKQSPILQNDKSFCSYADIIAQDDHESKFQIRRPSLSVSLSNPKLARTNSISSSSNYPLSSRSPNNNCNSNNMLNSHNPRSSTLNNIGSVSIKASSSQNSTATNDDDHLVFSSSIVNTPKTGFSGRLVSAYGSTSPNLLYNSYSMKVSSSNTSGTTDRSHKKEVQQQAQQNQKSNYDE